MISDSTYPSALGRLEGVLPFVFRQALLFSTSKLCLHKLLCMYVWHIVPVSVSWRTANANVKHAAHVWRAYGCHVVNVCWHCLSKECVRYAAHVVMTQITALIR